MTDLDARVAALMKLADACRKQDGNDCVDERIALEQAIRAELQKPALHEPIDVEEVANSIQRDLCELEPYNPAAADAVCVDLVSLQLILQRNLESVLQGRAKPVQEEITDAERYRFLRANAAISDGRPFIAKSSMGGISQWTETHADEQVDAAIRASKGEKT